MMAPAASLHGVKSNDALRWTLLLTSQMLKIMVLSVLFTTIIMAVNNSCKNKVKARVNGKAVTSPLFSANARYRMRHGKNFQL